MQERVCIFTLGCKVNQYESDLMAGKLRDRGYFVTSQLERCDRYIINTCAVTAEAEKKSRQIIAKINKLNTGAKIYIVGCASQNNAASFCDKENVELITGTEKMAVIDKFFDRGVEILPLSKDYAQSALPKSAPNDRTRAYVKIQDGCNNFCSYCIIPYLRGRSRSRDIEDIKHEVKLLCDNGIKEAVLTGINISDYGSKEGSQTLSALMEALSEFDIRLRLGSLEEGIITEGFIRSLKKLKKFCPHFHLSLQSGSDKILKDMNRKYTAEQYLSSMEIIRKHFPDAAITTDIICGYPTETDAEMEETVLFCKKAALSDIHVFAYSAREGTDAYKLGTLDKQIVRRRVGRMIELKNRLRAEFINSCLNKSYNVLIEQVEGGYFTGHTENYIKAYVDILESPQLVPGTVYSTNLISLFADGAMAKII